MSHSLLFDIPLDWSYTRIFLYTSLNRFCSSELTPPFSHSPTLSRHTAGRSSQAVPLQNSGLGKQLHFQHRPIGVVVRDPVGKDLQPLLDRRLRGPVEESLRLRDVGAPSVSEEVLVGCVGAHSESTSSSALCERLRPCAEVNDFVLGIVQAFRPAQAIVPTTVGVRTMPSLPIREVVTVTVSVRTEHGPSFSTEILPYLCTDRYCPPRRCSPDARCRRRTS